MKARTANAAFYFGMIFALFAFVPSSRAWALQDHNAGLAESVASARSQAQAAYTGLVILTSADSIAIEKEALRTGFRGTLKSRADREGKSVSITLDSTISRGAPHASLKAFIEDSVQTRHGAGLVQLHVEVKSIKAVSLNQAHVSVRVRVIPAKKCGDQSYIITLFKVNNVWRANLVVPRYERGCQPQM